MGEGVMEATIISWMFNEGDSVKEDDSVVEIATDKVDSDVPTPVSGKIIKILKQKDEVAKIGEAIAILEVAGAGDAVAEQPQEPKSAEEVKTEIPNVDSDVVKGLEAAMELLLQPHKPFLRLQLQQLQVRLHKQPFQFPHQ